MKKALTVLSLVAVATIAPVAASAAPSAAVTSTNYDSAVNVTINGGSKPSNGKVVAKDNVYGSADIWPGYGTYTWYGWKDLDYFWVPGGCDAWNINTGYKYVGNKTYGPLPSGTSLILQVRC